MPDQKSSSLPSYPFEIGPFGSPTLAYDVLRMTAPVCRVSVPSGLEPWLVTRYEDVYTVHRSPIFSRAEAVRVGAALVKNPGIELKEGVIQNTDGEQHSRLRTVFASHYSHAHTFRWAEVVQNEAHETIDHLNSGTVFDLRTNFFEPLARRSAEILFGFSLGQGSEILELFFDERIMLNFQDHLVSVLRNGDNLAKGSFLEALRGTCRDGLISESDLVINLTVFATVTFEALGGPFLGGLFAMLRDLDQWAACQRERSLLSNAVDEMLRCYPNGDGQFLRIAMENVVLSGVQIRRGDAVLAPAPAANVDPEAFPDPRRFDVHRPNSDKHIAFGIGKHRCLGSFLVAVWMRTALAVLLDRLPSLRLAVDPGMIKYRPIPLINIMERLPVIY